MPGGLQDIKVLSGAGPPTMPLIEHWLYLIGLIVYVLRYIVEQVKNC